MPFIVSADGTVFEKDVGPDTRTKAALTRYDPDGTWSRSEPTPAAAR